MQINPLNDALGREIFKKTRDQIATWDADKRNEIYALVYYSDSIWDDALEITLQYNTESEVKRAALEVDDPREARWYFTLLLQNQKDFRVFNIKNNEILRQWLDAFGGDAWGDDDEKLEVVDFNLRRALRAAVQELHKSGVLTESFGREIPAIIYDEIEDCDFSLDKLNVNVEANGASLPQEFIDYYREIVEG